MSKIFLIAGEKSGDNLGAKLIKQLRDLSAEISILGIGGEEMEKQGLRSLFPMKEINLMGFAEIIPHLPNLINRINFTVKTILEEKPDIVVTIDSPGFNYRVAKKLKEANFKGKLVHYVAPSVWAYKEKRALKTAKLFDLLLCILPWEPRYFEKHCLKTIFIGHPLFEDLNIISDEEKNLVRSNNLKSNQKLISIFTGSREGEVRKMLPTILESIKLIRKSCDVKIAFLIVPHLRNLIEENLKDFDEYIIEDKISEKQKIIQASDFAIVKSGTVSLEVSSLKCPQIVIYKVNSLSHFLIRRMVKIKYATLLNISANKEIIPELIQSDLTAKNLATKTLEFLENKNLWDEQILNSNIELEKLGANSGVNSSQNAAKTILGLVN